MKVNGSWLGEIFLKLRTEQLSLVCRIDLVMYNELQRGDNVRVYPVRPIRGRMVKEMKARMLLARPPTRGKFDNTLCRTASELRTFGLNWFQKVSCRRVVYCVHHDQNPFIASRTLFGNLIFDTPLVSGHGSSIWVLNQL